VAAGAFVACLVALAAASCRPAWYQPASVDFRTLPADKAALAAIENEISAALNAGRPVSVELKEAQVNRWLAAHHDLLAGVVMLPPELQRPCLRFSPAGIEAAAAVQLGAWSSIVSIRGFPRIDGDYLVLEEPGARVGRLGLPLAWILDRLNLGATANPAPGLRWSRTFVWTNGLRPCQLMKVELGHGTVHLTLAPTTPTAGGVRSMPSLTSP
jgi:hypothetical protein